MKVTVYQISSALGIEKFKTAVEFYKHMKNLHLQKVKFTPMVLVENIPGKEKPEWMCLNKYKKLEKEGIASGC